MRLPQDSPETFSKSDGFINSNVKQSHKTANITLSDMVSKKQFMLYYFYVRFVFYALMEIFHQVHRMEHIYLNSSDLQEYATKLKILMIETLLFLENF